MPHLVLEFSQGLEDSHDIPALQQLLFDTLAANPTIPTAANLKIRASAASYSLIGSEPQSFVHATLRLLPGRDDDTKSQLTGAVLEVLQSHLPTVGSLTVEAVEMHGASYAKRVL
ncbi:5-carboxymethyl-2-hydroxymuconate Delta-isomerase [Thalassobius sp. Cn5-15]|jgi:5-carboxymethyl-2-hydroxymuconate isomerase|uniref:5-carboxymethyl-2-hydroxymuconate Delta-isomerase n=1 Tax=Thalassobius sp. Cn5-15 TaxID=2917763 RepID=UPI001EF25B41|nr:5-carboxymethyl-2-hydroxymuconate isomerase [Thalassobius sp. Cn5-15]MCG7494679.1 5-carboxymethyl-2-hydroxymuconate isomerase [Thalassobius sp. Cn5-15]